jgi:hypothetical protein
LNIGNGTARGSLGAINIGSGTTKAVPITIGSSASYATLNGTSVTITTKLITPQIDTATNTTDLLLGSNIVGGQIKMGGAIVNGSVFICGGNQFSGALNIASNSTTALNTINLGNENTTVKIPNKLVTPIIDTATASTTLKIGSNITDANIEIGGAQTTGDIIIGNNNLSGATVTIGKSLTVTTINGSLSTGNNFLLSGVSSTSNSHISGKIRVEVNQGSRTIILANYNNEVVFINTGTGGGGGGFTLPTVAPTGLPVLR